MADSDTISSEIATTIEDDMNKQKIEEMKETKITAIKEGLNRCPTHQADAKPQRGIFTRATVRKEKKTKHYS